jgi:hypothetical protein
VTNVPAQALALLNDPFVLQQAERWGAALTALPDATVEARIDHLFRTALGRPPAPDETTRFVQAASRFATLHAVPPAQVLTSRAVWQDLAHAMFNLKEFITIR